MIILLFFIWGVYLYGDEIQPLTSKWITLTRGFYLTLVGIPLSLIGVHRRSTKAPWYVQMVGSLQNRGGRWGIKWDRDKILTLLITVVVNGFFFYHASRTDMKFFPIVFPGALTIYTWDGAQDAVTWEDGRNWGSASRPNYPKGANHQADITNATSDSIVTSDALTVGCVNMTGSGNSVTQGNTFFISDGLSGDGCLTVDGSWDCAGFTFDNDLDATVGGSFDANGSQAIEHGDLHILLGGDYTATSGNTTITEENAVTGYAFNNDGTLVNSNGTFIFTFPGTTLIDTLGTSGNLYNVILNDASLVLTQNTATDIDNNLTVTLGEWTTNTGLALGVDGDVDVSGTLNTTTSSSVILGSITVQATGTLQGNGSHVLIDNETAGGYAVDIDGTISGTVDIEITTTGGTNADLLASSGTVNDIIITTGSTDTVTFEGNTQIGNSVIVNLGIFEPDTNARTLTVGNNIEGAGSFGKSGWVGLVTLEGDWDVTTYLHGNQTIDFNGSGVQDILKATTFYNLTVSVGTLRFDNLNVTVTNVLTTLITTFFLMRGVAGTTILTMGTASGSGTIANAGTFRPHDTSGSFNCVIQAANTNFYDDLTGAGVYDWDYGTNNGRVDMKWLDHKGTDATAKETGGGGVSIQLNGRCDFYEDWTVTGGDTFNVNNQDIGIKKDLRRLGTVSNYADVYILSGGTGDIADWSMNDLFIQTDLQYIFDGTITATGDVSWVSATGDFIAADADVVLNVTGGIKVPIGAYFGADSSGLLGDTNPVSDWTADQAWGYLQNQGTSTPARATITMNSRSSINYVFRNTGTFIHNNCIIKTAGVLQQLIRSGGDDLYRLDNQNTTANVTFDTDNVSMDGIWFTDNTVTEADTITVTLTGYTPALGSVGPFTRLELIADGRVSEINGGLFDFGPYEVPDSEWIRLKRLMVLYSTSETFQDDIINVVFVDSDNRNERMCEIYIDDPTGSEGANYLVGTPLRILYHNGTEYTKRWTGMVDDRDDSGTDGARAIISGVGFDAWLRKQFVNAKFNQRNHTLLELLSIMITRFTPLFWDSSLVDLASNPSTLQPEFQGVTVEDAIIELLQESDNEEFWVDDDLKFNVRQRETSSGGSFVTPSNFDDDDWFDYEFDTLGVNEVNRVEVFFGSAGTNMAVAEDRTRQTDLQTTTGANAPVVVVVQITRKDIVTLFQAQAVADTILEHRAQYQRGTYLTSECYDCLPGMVGNFLITEKTEFASGKDMKIIKTEYNWGDDETILTLEEPINVSSFQQPGTGTTRNIGNKGNRMDVQDSDNTWDMQSTEWDSDADFNLWGLGVGLQVTGGAIEPSAAVVNIVATSPWIVPGTGKDAVQWWWLVHFLSNNNDGDILVEIEGSSSGLIPGIDYDKLWDSFLNTENLRFKLTFNWNGAGSRPTFNFGAIHWK